MTSPPHVPKPPRRLPTQANQREIGAITDLLLDMDRDQLANGRRAEEIVVARERADGRPALRIVGRDG